METNEIEIHSHTNHVREKDDVHETRNPPSTFYANAEDNPVEKGTYLRLSGLADSRDPDQRHGDTL